MSSMWVEPWKSVFTSNRSQTDRRGFAFRCVYPLAWPFLYVTLENRKGVWNQSSTWNSGPMTHKIGGTLIIVAPMRNGIVVSADSLQSTLVPGRFKEDVQKIRVLADRTDLAYFVAGTVRFTPPASDGVEPNRLKPDAPIHYDTEEDIRDYLTCHSPKVINLQYIELLAAHCKTHITDADSKHIIFGTPGTPELVFRAAIIQHNPEAKRSIVGAFSICRDIHGDIYLFNPQCVEYSLTDAFSFIQFGADQFLKDPRARLCSPDFCALFDSLAQTTIADLGEANAIRVTSDAIGAAAAIKSRFYPTVAEHFGGNVYTCTIDGVRSPSITPLGQVMRS
jgi:hypothetical protein